MSGVNWRRANFTFKLAERHLTDSWPNRGLLQQDVAIGQQADDQPFQQVFLADDDFVDFIKQRLHKGAGPLDLLLIALSPMLIFFDLTLKSTMEPENAFRNCRADFKSHISHRF